MDRNEGGSRLLVEAAGLPPVRFVISDAKALREPAKVAVGRHRADQAGHPCGGAAAQLHPRIGTTPSDLQGGQVGAEDHR